MRFPTVLLAACLLAACAAPVRDGAGDEDVALLLLGEQHDAPQHQQLHADVVQALADRGRLAAVVLEMAEQGSHTRSLAKAAGEDEVRRALRWNAQAWPWSAYGPAVMAAVRAGVPVLGGNLPRDRMQDAMRDEMLERLLPRSAWQAQQDAIRAGHCHLIADDRIPAMARVQVARDRAMAGVLAAAATPGRTVVLLAGSGHVDPTVGVPLHLPARLSVRPVMLPPQPGGKDHCEELRRRIQRPAQR